MYTLAKRYRFSAAHTLHSLVLSEGENQRVYGKCANPAGHGHDYIFEVIVSGPALVEDVVVGHGLVDDLVQEHVAPRFKFQNLNEVFGRGFITTGENLTRAVWNLVNDHLPPGLTLTVRLVETSKNAFVYRGEREQVTASGV